MPPRPNQLILILTVYILTLFTVLHTFRLALDLSPGRAPQTSSANTSAVSWSSALFSPSKLLRTLYEPKPENGQGVSWLVRLGWGLGEATIEILESSPPRTFEARMAFFGKSIPEDGIVGWLVPLDSLFGPCNDIQSGGRATQATLPSPPSNTPVPPPFLPLDGAYVPLPQAISDEAEPADSPKDTNKAPIPDILENTGCSPLCPLIQDIPIPGLPWPLTFPHPFPNTTWLALVRRGTCSFASKAHFAESLGASGMLVGGLDETLISMSAGSVDGDIGIRSLFVGNRTYHSLMERVQESGVRLDVDAGASSSALEGSKEVDTALTTRSVKTILVRLEGEPPWEWYTPILSVLLVLSLPSLLTLCTLFVHRLRAERREREMRAPEDVVAGLPIRVWSGVRWEKDLERGDTVIPAAPTETSPILPVRSISKEDDRGTAGYGTFSDAEPSSSAPRATVPLLCRSSVDADSTATGQPDPADVPTPQSPTRVQPRQHRQEESDETIPRPPWFTSQTECAICLCNFEIGDRVRVLPCGHVFHLDEVDPWLIKQRKVCPVCKYDVTNPPTALVPPSVSPLASPALLPAEAHGPSPTLDDLADLPRQNLDSSSSSDSGGPTASQPITAAQLLASVEGRQRGWRRWFGRRLGQGSSGSSDERVERREDQESGQS